MTIDRTSQALRPPGPNAGTQRWRDLLFLHWPLPQELARAVLPEGLELDLWRGQPYIGLVAFAMEKVRPRWLPRAFALDFLETNVRTYVLHRGEPGVFFLSLEAASWLAVQAARRGWGLPYFHADMSLGREGSTFTYATRRRSPAAPQLRAVYEPGAALGPSAPGGVEHFLLERYLLFVERRGQLLRGQVHHRPYPAHSARLVELDQDLSDAAQLGPCEGPPTFVHYSPGVDVEVFALTPVGRAQPRA